MRVSFRTTLKKDAKVKLKVLSALQGKPMNEILEELIEEASKKQIQREASK